MRYKQRSSTGPGMAGGMGGGGMMGGKGGMGNFQMLDDWTAPPFFVFMKQLKDMEREVSEASGEVRRLCLSPEEPQIAKIF